MVWIVYAAVVLLISGVVGLHLGRFREAYTEMTGMMVGMTMGMLNGFVLGYAAGAYFASMFWGNLVGVLLGLVLGVYFGRSGGLMGIMDGGMGGVMGGAMGAMLALMMLFPTYALFWTAVLLSAAYILGMIGLVVLIERSAPGHRALHVLAPFFTRAVAAEIAEEMGRSRTAANTAYFDDYYTFLNVSQDATKQEITDAYLEILSLADEETVARAERALSTLSDPARRHAYDLRLTHSIASGDCCPPPNAPRSVTTSAVPTVAPSRTPVRTSIPSRRMDRADVVASSANRNQPKGTSSHALQSRHPSADRTQARSRPRAPQRRESPISWIGGIAILVIAAFLLIYWLANNRASAPGADASGSNAYTDNGSALSADFVKQLESQAITVPAGADGTQTLNIVVNGDHMSYSPRVMRVKQGQPVTFNLTTEGRDPG